MNYVATLKALGRTTTAGGWVEPKAVVTVRLDGAGVVAGNNLTLGVMGRFDKLMLVMPTSWGATAQGKDARAVDSGGSVRVLGVDLADGVLPTQPVAAKWDSATHTLTIQGSVIDQVGTAGTSRGIPRRWPISTGRAIWRPG